jgi:hypothetical protein
MSGRFMIFLHEAAELETLHSADWRTGQTIVIIVVIEIGLIVVVVGASAADVS